MAYAHDLVDQIEPDRNLRVEALPISFNFKTCYDILCTWHGG
jgi:hypothetical protein